MLIQSHKVRSLLRPLTNEASEQTTWYITSNKLPSQLHTTVHRSNYGAKLTYSYDYKNRLLTTESSADNYGWSALLPTNSTNRWSHFRSLLFFCIWLKIFALMTSHRQWANSGWSLTNFATSALPGIQHKSVKQQGAHACILQFPRIWQSSKMHKIVIQCCGGTCWAANVRKISLILNNTFRSGPIFFIYFK